MLITEIALGVTDVRTRALASACAQRLEREVSGRRLAALVDALSFKQVSFLLLLWDSKDQAAAAVAGTAETPLSLRRNCTRTSQRLTTACSV
jgi:hypothetical protein